MNAKDKRRQKFEWLIANWLKNRIEDGGFDPEDIPHMMARYAMTDPEDMIAEFEERLELQAQETE